MANNTPACQMTRSDAGQSLEFWTKLSQHWWKHNIAIHKVTSRYVLSNFFNFVTCDPFFEKVPHSYMFWNGHPPVNHSRMVGCFLNSLTYLCKTSKLSSVSTAWTIHSKQSLDRFERLKLSLQKEIFNHSNNLLNEKAKPIMIKQAIIHVQPADESKEHLGRKKNIHTFQQLWL